VRNITREFPTIVMTRVGLLVAVPVAVVLAVQALAWASLPSTWSSGDTLTATALNSNFDAIDRRLSALESGIGAHVKVITATVFGANGGVATATYPDGYTLASISLTNVTVTESGTFGWPFGAYGCGMDGGKLTASLINYAAGSPQTQIACLGLCVR